MTSSQTISATPSPVAQPATEQTQQAPWDSLLGSSVRAAVLIMLVSGLAYPLLTTGVAQAVFPHAANGSLVVRDGQIVGAALIGQHFDSAPYFHGRPSVTTAPDPDKEGTSKPSPYNAGLSGASNQGATHQDLADKVAQRVAQYRALNGVAANVAVPVDAVTASASGLDPHISLANAALQIPRVMQARGLPQAQVQHLIDQATEQRTGYLLGEPRVNVLQLNLALDALPNAPVARKE